MNSKKPDIVGLAEAAEILGWKKQQISLYLSREKFPKPTWKLASGPIWLKSQIEEFKANREVE